MAVNHYWKEGGAFFSSLATCFKNLIKFGGLYPKGRHENLLEGLTEKKVSKERIGIREVKRAHTGHDNY